AAGQGALGIECRSDDQELATLLSVLNDAKTHAEVSAERALVRRLGGGCSIPIAAFATIQDDILTLNGFIANPEGTDILRASATGSSEDAKAIGLAAAEQLIRAG